MILKRMHFKQVIENLIKAGLYITFAQALSEQPHFQIVC